MQSSHQVSRIVRNGDGRRVLFRADMDALPLTEATGLEYSSTEPGKSHVCGHDAHVASGLGAAALLAKNKSEWSGTYLALFQPGEETGKGAQAMIGDGLVAKLAAIKPDVCLAKHVLRAESGHLATRSGAVLSAGDSIKVTVFGKGSHGSMPQLGVDPAVLASSIVMRLQGIVSREIAPGEFGVVTVGAIKVGSAPNVISDRAELLLNVRACTVASCRACPSWGITTRPSRRRSSRPCAPAPKPPSPRRSHTSVRAECSSLFDCGEEHSDAGPRARWPEEALELGGRDGVVDRDPTSSAAP